MLGSVVSQRGGAGQHVIQHALCMLHMHVLSHAPGSVA